MHRRVLLAADHETREAPGLAGTDMGIARGLSAVVADDMPLLRLGLATALGLVGLTSVVHADGLTDGIAAARRTGAGVLVVGLPTATGASALRSAIADLTSTRVVVLVAHTDRASLVALLEAGADAVALRTVAPDDLAGLVRQVLDGERAVGPALLSVLLDHTHAGPVAGEQAAAAGVATGLTTRELAVLTRLAHGESNAEIASALFVSPATVKTHLAHIYGKLGVGSRHGAMSRAVALGLLH